VCSADLEASIRVSATVGFLAIDGEADLVLEWFAKQPDVTSTATRPDGVWFAFGAAPSPGAVLDPTHSPLAYVIAPSRLRGVLWSAGEVGFTATPMRQFPHLLAAHRKFTNWLKSFDLVFSRRAGIPGQWDYYLEGGLRNRDIDLYAMPNASRALRAEQYFVRNGISDRELDTLCGALGLRGIVCGPAAEQEDEADKVRDG
jgi:hypothetical protein